MFLCEKILPRVFHRKELFFDGIAEYPNNEYLTVSEFLSIHNWVRSTFHARKHELVLIAGEYLRA